MATWNATSFHSKGGLRATKIAHQMTARMAQPTREVIVTPRARRFIIVCSVRLTLYLDSPRKASSIATRTADGADCSRISGLSLWSRSGLRAKMEIARGKPIVYPGL